MLLAFPRANFILNLSGDLSAWTHSNEKPREQIRFCVEKCAAMNFSLKYLILILEFTFAENIRFDESMSYITHLLIDKSFY